MAWRGWLVLLGLVGCGPGIVPTMQGEGEGESGGSSGVDPEPDPPPASMCDPIRFEDPTVEEEALRLLWPRPEPIDGGYSADALSGVTQLDLREPTSLVGIECLRGLEVLELSHADVDLDALPDLPALRELELSQGSVVGSWAGLRAKYPGLESLTLDDTYEIWEEAEPFTLDAISPWATLRVLSLHSVAPAEGNLDAIAELRALVALEVTGGGLTDVSGLSGHAALQSVSLRGHQLGDVRLEDMPALETLEFDRSELTALQIDAAANLTALRVPRNALTSLPPLADLPALRSLVADDNPLSLVGVGDAASLRELSVAGCGLTDDALAPLFGTRLEVLDLSGNELQLPSALADLAELDILDLSSNPISDASFLENTTWPEACDTLLVEDTPLAEHLDESDAGVDPGVNHLCEAGTYVSWLGDWPFTGRGSCNGECAPAPPE